MALGSGLWVRLQGRLLRAECINVSMSGALIELELDVEGALDPEALLGSTGALELVHRCGEERLAVGARFVIARIVGGSDHDCVHMGVHFTGLDTASSIHLYNLIRWQGD